MSGKRHWTGCGRSLVLTRLQSWDIAGQGIASRFTLESWLRG